MPSCSLKKCSYSSLETIRWSKPLNCWTTNHVDFSWQLCGQEKFCACIALPPSAVIQMIDSKSTKAAKFADNDILAFTIAQVAYAKLLLWCSFPTIFYYLFANQNGDEGEPEVPIGFPLRKNKERLILWFFCSQAWTTNQRSNDHIFRVDWLLALVELQSSKDAQVNPESVKEVSLNLVFNSWL